LVSIIKPVDTNARKPMALGGNKPDAHQSDDDRRVAGWTVAKFKNGALSAQLPFGHVRFERGLRSARSPKQPSSDLSQFEWRIIGTAVNIDPELPF
jgi:hypothetical protein